MAKISIIIPSENEQLLNLKRSAFTSILQNNNTIQIIGLPDIENGINSYFDEGKIGPQLLETVKYLQSDRSNAIIIDHIRDPLLSAARQISNIPVLGIGQTAFHLTCMLADNFSVITTSKGISSAVEHNAQEYQLANKLWATQSIESQFNPNSLNELKEKFLKAALSAIKKDTHALIIDSGGLANTASFIQQELVKIHIQIPVLDPTQVTIKLAEALVSMGLSHSKRSYPNPPTTDAPGYNFSPPLIYEEIAGQFELNAEVQVIVPSSEEGVDTTMGKAYSSYCSPGVKLNAVKLDIGPCSIESEYDDAIAIPQVFKKLEESKKQGKDADLIDCMFDVGLRGGREITDALFLGPGITSFHIGSILSDKTTIITVLNQSIPEIERQICRYSLMELSSPVRAVELHVLELREDSYDNRLVDEFVIEAVKAIEEENSQFIIPGCTGMVGLQEKVSAAAKKYNVPVIDQNMALVKVCELFLSLGLSHSKRSFPNPSL